VIPRRLTCTVAVACLTLLAGGVSAPAADTVPSIRKLVQKEREVLTEYGAAIIKAARSKPQKIELDTYQITQPKPNRTELSLKMIYHGLISRRRYVADVKMLIDSTDRDNWEVLTIKYSDNNPNIVGPNLRKVDELIKRFNR
jgi:hypothetical protein